MRLRTALIAALSGAALLATAPSACAQVKWRAAGNFAVEHTSTEAMKLFKEEVEKATGGKLAVDLFPAMQLGGAQENVQAVRTGSIQVVWIGMAFLSRTVPELEALSLPFLFTSREQAFRVADGPIGKEIDRKMADKGLTLLGFMELGARHVTNSKRPIKTLEDLKGLKIRLQPNETHLATFRALGANAVAMDVKELYPAMQQGVVDGQENPYSIIAANRYFEVQKFMTNTGHFFDFITIVAHRKSFESLPASQQKAIRDGIDAATRYQRERAKLQEVDSLATIRQRGVTFDEASPKLLADMRAASAGIVEDVKKRAGEDLVKRVLAEAAKK
ncbi:MAG: TRAP transporter substrate-binding protein [Burkholderiales bacterium]|jgi:tripartite ATP-independent transporter DctP family solute receptor